MAILIAILLEVKKRDRQKSGKNWLDLRQTRQRLADQVRMIIKKGWSSDLEILEIHQQINRKTCQRDLNTVTETLNTEKKTQNT